MRASFSEAAFSWPDFSVVHFDAKESVPPAVKSWGDVNRFVHLDSCARKVIWAAPSKIFQDFPFASASRDFTLLHGAPAYGQVLRLLTGMMSKRVGEDHIVHQYREKWAQFKSRHPELEAYLRPMQTALEQDNALIRKGLVDLLIPPQDEYAVRILSGLQKNDRILMAIAPEGDMSSVKSRTLMKSFGNNRNGKPLVSEIGIIGDTLDEGEQTARWLADLKHQKKLHKDIEISVLPKEDMSRAVELYDRLYVSRPMNGDAEMDQDIIQSWKNRIRRDNTLTHIGGDADRQSHWSSADLDNYVSPDALRDALKAIRDHNGHIVALIHEAIEYCASCRERGERPMKLAQVERVDYSIQPRPVVSP